MQSQYPTGIDLSDFLDSAGVTFKPSLQRFLGIFASAGVNQFEGKIGRKMLAGSAPVTRYLNPSTDRYGLMILDQDLCSVPTVVYAPQNSNPSTYVLDTDYNLLPENALADGYPIDRIKFNRNFWMDPISYNLRNSMQITGYWGYGRQIPDDAWLAMLMVGSVNLIVNPAAILSGGVVSQKVEDSEIVFGTLRQDGSGPFDQQILNWNKVIAQAVSNYVRLI